MYTVTVDDTPTIQVAAGKHHVSYAIDRSLMNPLEAFYATLAGCAAVYVKKSCKELGISAAGIQISSKPFAGTSGPLSLAKFKTEVSFPEHFSTEQKNAVLESVKHCAVKEIVATGSTIDFQVTEITS